MRVLSIILASAVLTTALSSAAEARRRGFSSSPAPAAAPSVKPAALPIVAVVPRPSRPVASKPQEEVRPAPEATGSAPGTLPTLSTLRQIEATGSGACPPDRLIGRGAGFCSIN